ncbi:MAG: nucleotide-binding protein [Verrucomicrobia bacterium]|jgi:hypothetical protein|nr:nucleotide-binding protein [Verrucomicrobiota bacterium]
MSRRPPAKAVFLNVPFDDAYKPLFEALVFCVTDCAFVPRCALETSDGGHVRVEKLTRIIADCAFGVHDISRTELDKASRLPRSNMPFELGLFLGAKRFGDRRQRRKSTLILERERYRFQQYLSDIAGQDIKAHDDNPVLLIQAVRDWLRDEEPRRPLPSSRVIAERYQRFRLDFPALCQRLRLDPGELTFNDYTWVIRTWLVDNG